MQYISQSLTFEEDRIYFLRKGVEQEVMMDWEDTLMSASAACVTQNGGDILEIGRIENCRNFLNFFMEPSIILPSCLR